MSVIVLLADGVRADTLTSALDAGALPSMARLRSEGGLHEVTSTFPSVTGPAYTPFLMGRFPGSVGLPGLRWFDRAREACSFPDYSRSYVGYQMGAVNRDINPDAPTIFELVPESAAALSMITRGLPRSRQIASLTAASAIRAAVTHFRGDVDAWLDVDREISQKVIARVQSRHSPYVFAAFMGVDKMSHAEGQDRMGVQKALRIIDDTVGALLDDRDRDRAGSATRIWVASDHGHSPVSHHEDLQRVIDGMGYRALAHPWVLRVGANVAVMVSGNAMAHVYVDLARRDRPFWDGLDVQWRSLAEQLNARDSVDLMLVPLSTSSCAVWSRERGRATVSHDGDRFSYCMGEGDPLGVGREFTGLSAAEAHEATRFTDYPDSVVQIAKLAGASRAGDFILSATRGWDFRARYEPIPHMSSHGALHREHMLVPLLLDCPVARQPRRTTDVMPSALAALGITVPRGLDGESFV